MNREDAAKAYDRAAIIKAITLAKDEKPTRLQLNFPFSDYEDELTIFCRFPFENISKYLEQKYEQLNRVGSKVLSGVVLDRFYPPPAPPAPLLKAIHHHSTTIGLRRRLAPWQRPVVCHLITFQNLSRVDINISWLLCLFT